MDQSIIIEWLAIADWLRHYRDFGLCWRRVAGGIIAYFQHHPALFILELAASGSGLNSPPELAVTAVIRHLNNRSALHGGTVPDIHQFSWLMVFWTISPTIKITRITTGSPY